ncbi:MAG TPA: DNA polymerase III subunit gamma/tau [Bacteroidia bacterium]|jgi:DNA polymerase-3 subunit gamma/tau|nr:DNA polymerase III subunit gamma/tau [Bacteroidia bacterium]
MFKFYLWLYMEERFVVSARKYRPQTFVTVVGQQHITTTLKNSIKNNHLAQAFLFCGPRGVGKTTCARILAKTINCFNLTKDTEACDECESCKSFNSGQSLNVFELDAASNNGVEEIRNLIDQVRFAPQLGQYKVYIIDEVHMLSASAFNAFLKTLEEPPRHAVFILATTEKHKIIPTILSRCQIFDFNRIQLEDISNHLAYIAKTEGITAEAEALRVIAQKADGGLRDACSMFDQMVSFGGTTLTYKTVIDNLHVLDYDYYFKVADALNTQDTSTALLVFNEIINNGFDGHQFIAGLGEHLRNLLVCKDAATVQLLEVSENVKQKYLKQAESCSMQFLLKSLGIINRCDVSYKSAKNQRLQVEIALLQMSYLNAAPVDAEKKNDTEQVATPQTTVAAVNKTPVTPVKTNAVAEDTPQYKTTDKPVTSFKDLNLNSGFRLQQSKQLVQQQAVAEEKVKETVAVVNEKFTIENVHLVTAGFVKMLQEKGKKQVANMLRPEMLLLKNETEVVIEIENSAQKESFEPVRQDFLDHLRKSLNNGLVSIGMQEKAADTTKKAYSPAEKFETMMNKNPSLLELKKRLDMELDY